MTARPALCLSGQFSPTRQCVVEQLTQVAKNVLVALMGLGVILLCTFVSSVTAKA